MRLFSQPGVKMPLYVALMMLVLGGVFLLERAESQARDTTRKHHIEDIEQSLYFARSIKGTYPPYGENSWCGTLSGAENKEVKLQVEEMLRAQNEKYANTAKPFPRDPFLVSSTADRKDVPDYFYWKRSPASFELYAILETDDNDERTTSMCDSSPNLAYDYGIASIWREN